MKKYVGIEKNIACIAFGTYPWFQVSIGGLVSRVRGDYCKWLNSGMSVPWNTTQQ